MITSDHDFLDPEFDHMYAVFITLGIRSSEVRLQRKKSLSRDDARKEAELRVAAEQVGITVGQKQGSLIRLE